MGGCETREGGGRRKHIYTPGRTDGRSRTGAGQEREALKGIRVEVCWRGRLFGASDTSQWAPALGNPITATGGTEQRRRKRLLSDRHLGVRTKRFELQKAGSESDSNGRPRSRHLRGEKKKRKGGGDISRIAKKKSIPHKYKKKQRLILCFLERTFNYRGNLKQRVLGNQRR